MNPSSSVQSLLTVLLMAMLFFVVFYMDMGILYKIFTAVLVFAIVFLLELSDKAFKQTDDRRF